MHTIAIIGAGASGMMAALTAAEQTDNQILLFERQARPGRKLMATGNGRCNLTNRGAAPEHYHSETPGFADAALAGFPPEETLAWFQARGLLTVTEESGRVYPLSNAANSVLDVLRFALQQPNITLRTGEAVTAVRRRSGGFAVETASDCIEADFVIVACGGAAGAKLGGVRDGYTLLQSLGHRRTALHPALVQLTTDPTYPRALKGVRADARLTLSAPRTVLARTAGEVQFTEKGVSGPAVFDLSRAASTGGEGLTLTIDFLRDYPAKDVLALLRQRRETAPELPAEEVLTGAVHNRVGKMLLRYARFPAARPLRDVTDDELKAIARACKTFVLPVRGTEGFENAQVTAGGVRADEFDPQTLESRLVPGLFACGEVLDVDGDCGGYNLQWAWASGRKAGRLGR
ncbi:MAG: NAD(P)/FAD-dependent oxidoreductase [Oscillospiraceae bacterium]